jgi:adenylate cyclase
MAKDRLSGKLAVILHADVAGSTQLVQQDEQLAHERIQDAFRRFNDTIGKYHGRVIEIRGDALLAEFQRASDAVTAALAFQAGDADHNVQLDNDIQPRLRIGVALGEVVIADNTVTGAGVVLAQRIEQLAEPGGLCITGAIHEALPQRMPFDLADLGEQAVKGFDLPVRVYRVQIRSGETIPLPQNSGQLDLSLGKQRLILAVTLTVGFIIGAIFYWFQPWLPEEEPASVEHMAFPLPDKPSIAVLPFDTLSDDKDQEYLADGITKDIITDLSRFGDLVVIAAQSTFTYKSKPVKSKQVAEELGVRYVVQGSLQKAGNQVRINVQFIDAITGEHLWTERYVRDLDDVFAMQDEITQRIVSGLGTWSGRIAEVTLERVRRKGTTNLTAYEHFLLGLELLQHFTREDNRKARELFEKSIERDPMYSRAHAGIAWTYFFDWQRGWSESEDFSAARAYEFAKTAVELDSNEAEAHWILTYVNFWIKQLPDEAIAGAERALALNPNHSDILADWGGFIMPLLTGRADEGLELVKKAMRLNPSHPDWYEQAFSVAAYSARRYDDALSALRKVEYHGLESRLVSVASYAQLGRLEEARAEVAKLLELHPHFSLKEFNEKFYFKNQADRDHYLDGLRKAGVSERPPLRLPDKPSIAVLPFTNMSADAEQEYFVDGMTEDLITDLSKVAGLFVIARNSVFTYKGKAVKVRQAAEELGVRYVMEGSVRRVGNQVRINAQLIDATTGGHVWAERYDGSLDDVFKLQDKVIGEIISALKITLTPDERERSERKGTNNLDAHDAYLRGWQFYRRYTPEDFVEAIPHFERAVELDPDYGLAWAALASVYWISYQKSYTWTLIVNPNRDNFVSWLGASHKAERYLSQAMRNPTPLAHQIESQMSFNFRQFEKALSEAKQAIALDPNDPEGYLAKAWALIYAGRAEEAVALAETGMQLDPYYPASHLYVLGMAQLMMQQYTKAEAVLERALGLNPENKNMLLPLTVAYVHLDKRDQARDALKQFIDFFILYAPKIETYIEWWPFKREVDIRFFGGGLITAGLCCEEQLEAYIDRVRRGGTLE